MRLRDLTHEPPSTFGSRYPRLWWIVVKATVAWVVGISAVVGIVVGIVVGLAFGPMRTSCERSAVAMGLEHRWGFWEGCLVVHDGDVVHLGELRRPR